MKKRRESMRKVMTLALALAMITITGVAHAGATEAKAFYKEANAAFKEKNYADALDLYRKVEKAEPDYASYVQGQIGYCYYFMKDEGKALFYFEQHLKNKPDDSKVKKYVDHLKGKGVLPDAGGSGKTLSGEKNPKNVVFTNPGAIAGGLLNIGYQRVITDHGSLAVSGSMISVGYSGGDLTIAGGSIGWRFSTRGVRGWFFAPKVGYWTGSYDESVTSLSTLTTTTVEFSGSSIGFGAEAGYQWVWNNGVMLGLGAGANHLSLTMEATATDGTVTESANGTVSGVVPNGFLNLGYAF
jgi:hypothetical protein